MRIPTLNHAIAMAAFCGIASLLATPSAHAVPSFARQTGQNCVACHAGGNFPELTPYGRMFKMTGYTIGERAMPVSAMGVVTMNKTRNTADPFGDPSVDFFKDGNVTLPSGSVFVAGKIAENFGGFAQITYNNYDSQDASGRWHGHTGADNIDLRYADRLISASRDLIFGVTLNNNPQVQDVWNSVSAWGYNTVPGSTGPATMPLIAGGLAQSAAGLGAYAFLNQTVYAELSMYRTADRFLSFMSAGHNTDRGDMQKLKGLNPYFRLALSHDWGAHNGMVGVYGLRSRLYPDPTNPAGETVSYRDVGVDGQYQYLLDPHTITAQMSFVRERISYPSTIADQSSEFVDANGNAQANTNASDRLNIFRAKATYVYRARYGGSLSFFNVTGTTNTLNQTSGYDPATGAINAAADPNATVASTPITGNLSGNPASRGWTAEVFWMPVQYARIGLQYTMFSKYNGATSNYDGFGRNPGDNNTLFLYGWVAY